MVAAVQPSPQDPMLALNATTVLLAVMGSSDAGTDRVVAADALPAALRALQHSPPPEYATVLLDVACRVGCSPHRARLLEAVPVLLDCLQPVPSEAVVRALLSLGMVVNGEGVLTTIATHTYGCYVCNGHVWRSTMHRQGVQCILRLMRCTEDDDCQQLALELFRALGRSEQSKAALTAALAAGT